MASDADVDAALELEEAMRLEDTGPLNEAEELGGFLQDDGDSDSADDELFKEAARQMEERLAAQAAQAAAASVSTAASVSAASGQTAAEPSRAATPTTTSAASGCFHDVKIEKDNFVQQHTEIGDQSTAVADSSSALGLLKHCRRVRTGENSSPVDLLAQRLEHLCCDNEGRSCANPRAALNGTPCEVRTECARYETVMQGVHVVFPFPGGPLQPQQEVMNCLISALKSKKHAVVESPTGTGKTAAVLCSAIAWQRQQRRATGRAPQIFFSSRTHAQLQQVVSELSRSPYKPTMAVIGSREAGLCINADVSSSRTVGQQSVRQACRKARRSGGCSFYQGLSKTDLPEESCTGLRQGRAWDIEDIAGFGRQVGACPYYLAHTLARYAELVLCPYSYLLDASVRQSVGASGIDLRDCIVIIDEAHNVEGTSRDAGSVEFSVEQMRACLGEFKKLLSGLSGADEDLVPTSLTEAAPNASATAGPASQQSSGSKKPKAGAKKRSFEMGGFLAPDGSETWKALEAAMHRASPSHSDEPKEKERKDASLPKFMIRPVRALMDVFGRLCTFVSDTYSAQTFAPYLEDHNTVAAFFKRLRLHAEPLFAIDPAPENDAMKRTKGENILLELASRRASGILEFAATFFSQLAAAAANPRLYVVHVSAAERKMLNLWLMKCEGTLGPISSQLHSLVLMSGTLAPVATTEAELGDAFRQRSLPPVEANHVVHKQALKLLAVSHQGNMKLECTYHAWKRGPFLQAIGAALVELTRSIPAGVLVFFPSYDLLERCIQAWQAPTGQDGKRKRARGAVERVVDTTPVNAIWDQLVAEKETVVMEPPPTGHPSFADNTVHVQAYDEARKRYEGAVRACGRAMLLAVYRGRMSEGVSFHDDFARGVICVGIPFPNIKEERVSQKRSCNDFWVKTGQGAVSGDAWYEARALQAVAQALGRCIRHPGDHGGLVLLDSRWAELGKYKSLPRWLQPFFEEQRDTEAAATSLRRHFESIAARPAQSQAQAADAAKDQTSSTSASAAAAPASGGSQKRAFRTALQRAAAPKQTAAQQRGLATGCIDLDSD
eukprot:TRINITY_DN73339_c0_g1_i2.p1 TRINITY_DN73339_c0_g1~~TRINITY_DN73339_c0_g1_i2.p1  ORF type:complete len:1103 (-),score=178.03 TRINITY_DN73339_c0_g1_i2:710-3907(-)